MDNDTHGTSREGNEGHLPSLGIEPLGEGYDDLDHQLDAHLSSTSQEFRSTPVPEGFVDRVFNASMDARDEAEAPLSFTHGLPRQRPVALKLAALAACLGMAVTAAMWLADGRSTRTVPVPGPVVVELETSDMTPNADAMNFSSEAEWAMLASSREHQQLERLSSLVVTRDMGFGDVTGDLVSVIDAIHDPGMQTFDLEWQR